MYPKLKTTLYHGTISEIKRVDVTVGKDRKDFIRKQNIADTLIKDIRGIDWR